MIIGFADEASEDIFYNRTTKAARKLLPEMLHRKARVKLSEIDYAPTVESLTKPPGNRLEALQGTRLGQWSIRINDQYRICFSWVDGNPNHVEIINYH